MKPEQKFEYQKSLSTAREQEKARNYVKSFSALERAHILGQRYLIPHIQTHLLMLRIGWKQRDLREIFGQILRLAATIPGYILGWVPKGNTGGSNVSAIRPIPLQGDLAKLLADYNVWQDVFKRVILFSILATCFILMLLVLDNRHQTASAALSEHWSSQNFEPVSLLRSTNKLSVTPVVNYFGEPEFATESGVSYLVETDEHTILFDLGHNHKETPVSPLEYNLKRLGVAPKDLDAIFISHFHRDHIGGRTWEDKNSIGFGFNQPALINKSIFAPIALKYPGVEVNVIQEPKSLFGALASTGPIPRQLVLGRIDEQALLINVKDKGLVVIVGCGHQTLNKLIGHIEKHFNIPLYGLIGDVHFPLEEGRLHIAGIDIQRRLASGEGLFSPIDKHDVLDNINLMSQKFNMIALGAHDTSDKAIELVKREFTGEFITVRVGKKISINQSGLLKTVK